jgi:molecular chaperone GrpE
LTACPSRKFIDWRQLAGDVTQELGGVGVLSDEEESHPKGENLKDEGKSPGTRLPRESGRESELLDRLKYMQADFENYRKRTEKEMGEIEESSSKGLVLRLLSVLDELDLAVKHSKEDNGKTEFKEGIEMVQKNLFSALESVGLQRIESVGEPFDPSKHEAVEKVQGSLSGPDIIVEEMRAGYAFRGHVIRPSMVKVELAMKEPVDGGKTDE